MESPGYTIQAGHIGFVNGRRMLFSTEQEYHEYISEKENDDET